MRWVGLSLVGFVELIKNFFFLREGQMHTHMHYADPVTYARLKSNAIHDAISLFCFTNAFYFSTFLLHFIHWSRLKVDVFQLSISTFKSKQVSHFMRSTPTTFQVIPIQIPSKFQVKSQLKKWKYNLIPSVLRFLVDLYY